MSSRYDIYDRIAEIVQAREQPWRQRAACRGMGTGIFYPPDSRSGRPVKDAPTPLAEARSICERCPVQAECVADALAFEGDRRFGCWGGTSPNQRREMRRQNPPPGPPPGRKRCPDCDAWRPLDDFAADRSKHDGLQSYCRAHTYRRNRSTLARREAS